MGTSMQELRRKWAQAAGVMNFAGPQAAGAPSWYRILNRKAESADPVELYIYDEIGWFGVSAAEFASELRGLDAPNGIELHINSPGGAASDGVAIFNALCNHPAEIVTVVDGWAASAASVIAMAGKRIKMRTGALMMIHKAWGVCMGNDDDMVASAELLRTITGSLADIYTERRGGVRAEWLAAMTAETWYTPEQAVAAGIADEHVKDERETEDARAAVPVDVDALPTAGASMISDPPVEPLFDVESFQKALREAFSS